MRFFQGLYCLSPAGMCSSAFMRAQLGSTCLGSQHGALQKFLLLCGYTYTLRNKIETIGTLQCLPSSKCHINKK